jgi:hypothetical protein
MSRSEYRTAASYTAGTIYQETDFSSRGIIDNTAF